MNRTTPLPLSLHPWGIRSTYFSHLLRITVLFVDPLTLHPILNRKYTGLSVRVIKSRIRRITVRTVFEYSRVVVDQFQTSLSSEKE